MDYEPQNPCEEALTAELAYLYHSLVAAYCCHRAEVVVFEGCEAVVSISLVNLLEILCQVLSLLYSHLSHLRMSVGISLVGGLEALVANSKHTVQPRYTVAGLP